MLAVDRMKASGKIRDRNQGVTACLAGLTRSREWKRLATGFGRGSVLLIDIQRCQTDLYQSFSKAKHGTSGVDLSTLTSEAEKAALKATFTMANIGYSE